MEKFAAAFSDFLGRHNIDPDAVHLIVRTKDDATAARMGAAMKLEFSSSTFHGHAFPPDFRHMKLHGITIKLGSLDYSR